MIKIITKHCFNITRLQGFAKVSFGVKTELNAIYTVEPFISDLGVSNSFR